MPAGRQFIDKAATANAVAAVVANADATYGQPEADLINELKANFNAAVTLINELKTTVNELVEIAGREPD